MNPNQRAVGLCYMQEPLFTKKGSFVSKDLEVRRSDADVMEWISHTNSNGSHISAISTFVLSKRPLRWSPPVHSK